MSLELSANLRVEASPHAAVRAVSSVRIRGGAIDAFKRISPHERGLWVRALAFTCEASRSRNKASIVIVAASNTLDRSIDRQCCNSN